MKSNKMLLGSKILYHLLEFCQLYLNLKNPKSIL